MGDPSRSLGRNGTAMVGPSVAPSTSNRAAYSFSSAVLPAPGTPWMTTVCPGSPRCEPRTAAFSKSNSSSRPAKTVGEARSLDSANRTRASRTCTGRLVIGSSGRVRVLGESTTRCDGLGMRQVVKRHPTLVHPFCTVSAASIAEMSYTDYGKCPTYRRCAGRDTVRFQRKNWCADDDPEADRAAAPPRLEPQARTPLGRPARLDGLALRRRSESARPRRRAGCDAARTWRRGCRKTMPRTRR